MLSPLQRASQELKANLAAFECLQQSPLQINPTSSRAPQYPNPTVEALSAKRCSYGASDTPSSQNGPPLHWNSPSVQPAPSQSPLEQRVKALERQLQEQTLVNQTLVQQRAESLEKAESLEQKPPPDEVAQAQLPHAEAMPEKVTIPPPSDKAGAQMDQLKAQIDQLKAQMDQLKADHAAEVSRLHSALNSRRQSEKDLADQLEQSRQRLDIMQPQLEAAEQDAVSSRQQVAWLEQRLEEAKEQVAKQEEDASSTIKQLWGEEKEWRAEEEKYVKRETQLQAQLKDQHTLVATLKGKLSKREEELERLREERDRLPEAQRGSSEGRAVLSPPLTRSSGGLGERLAAVESQSTSEKAGGVPAGSSEQAFRAEISELQHKLAQRDGVYLTLLAQLEASLSQLARKQEDCDTLMKLLEVTNHELSLAKMQSQKGLPMTAKQQATPMILHDSRTIFEV